MVVVTPVSVFRDRESLELHATVRQAAELLIESDIPIVLVGACGIREPEDIQRELGIVAPFLSGGGATVHVPDGYFSGTRTISANKNWEMVTFRSPDFDDNPSGGLGVLLETYRTHRSDIVVIGFGVRWSDRFLLRAVDVPVIIRNGHIDQSQLRKTFPDAFVTNSKGPLGWGEAILGRLAYESDETGMMGASWP
jgi:predicted mannosyl-3-phosphoglycerate phosphatase (HAD superfamily)